MAGPICKASRAFQNGLLRRPVPDLAIISGIGTSAGRTASSSMAIRRQAWEINHIRGISSSALAEQHQELPPEVTGFPFGVHNPGPIAQASPAHHPAPVGPSSSPSPPKHEPKELDEVRYWTHVPQWDDITVEEFISNKFQVKNTVKSARELERFLLTVLPEQLPPSKNPTLQHLKTKDDFIRDARAGLEIASMEVRLTPEILSIVDWTNPLDDPIRMQFITLKSSMLPDHPNLTLDSLGEQDDSPVPGLVHRYPGRALFLATSNCPVYCRYCTRAYMVGPSTGSTQKQPQKPSRSRWETMFEHIESHPDIQDIVVSGGDLYQLPPDQLRMIGERLLSIPHIKRFRVASKGLSVNPGRIIDPADTWGSTLIDLSNQGRKLGKQVCWHTHFNHPKEVTWIAKKAAHRLFQNGVIVRNQSVLQRGVNDDFATMKTLITALADINVQPYYVYQHDLTRSVEDLRTPLNVILDLDKRLRGNLSGFMMPAFVVDLPGGGGKRLASTYDAYDEATGVSKWSAPGLPGFKGERDYTYYDPHPLPVTAEELAVLRVQQDLMHKFKSTREEDFMKEEPATEIEPSVAAAAAAAA